MAHWSDVPCKLFTVGEDQRPPVDVYGMKRVDGRQRRVHILTWIEAHGPIPMEPNGRRRMSVCHHCDTPACYELTHLWLGTHAENVADMIAKGRKRNGNEKKTHCPHGHPYDEANTYIRKNGARMCRACAKVRDLKRSLRKR